MPRYVFSLIVGDQKYVIDQHGMEMDTLHEVHTNALRVLEHTFPFVPNHLRSSCRVSIMLPSGQTVLTVIPLSLPRMTLCGKRLDNSHLRATTRGTASCSASHLLLKAGERWRVCPFRRAGACVRQPVGRRPARDERNTVFPSSHSRRSSRSQHRSDRPRASGTSPRASP
jgi:hypothetical protein